MLPNWKEKKLTLVVIPEANRQVRQFRMSLLWVYAIPAAVLVLAAATTALVLLQSVLVQTNGQLRADWQGDRQSLEKVVEKKDEEIDRLQTELAMLVSETEQMRVKVEQLQQLEQELLSITENGADRTAMSNYSSVTVALSADHSADSADSAMDSLAVGGELYPADVDDTLELSRLSRSGLQELEVEADRLQSSLKDAKKHAERLAYVRSITPSIFPTVTTRITSTFGYRKDPFTRRSAYHRGIDFPGDVNDPVYATAGGKVSRTGYDKAMGNYIFINHGNGLETVYMHLKKSLVQVGQKVEKGEEIGKLGSTGRSTGPHLHYEVRKQGTPINPISYLDSTKKG
ncbi:M23 family metallopeptidase [Paenibacillus thermotolerans]|uniref:M23 family metallopeptidase n=1 Tax=Paenibacillus thermotolerans TaxID=3027807 RepID=UPI00236890B1|nr:MULTISPECIES: M23 family metallopeptidase [unclassified Paenibacillus]